MIARLRRALGLTCCICRPTLPINPHVCRRHKAAGHAIARRERTFVSQALGALYLEARQKVRAA